VSDAVLGAVLAGGASRRMGQDKAALTLDGTPLSHRVQRALFDGGVGAVVLVGGDQGAEGAIPDRWPGEGPLGALATAVGHGASVEGVAIVIVAACDQPDLPADLVAALVHALAAGPADACASAVRTPDGRVHPFPSAWRTAGAEALVALVDAGERRADAAFTIGPLIEVGADATALDDLDTPDDVRRWLERHHGTEPQPPGHRA